MTKYYNDNLDPNIQLDSEEYITDEIWGLIDDSPEDPITKGMCYLVASEILLEILTRFRPDLVEVK
jgi:hypothetical protein